MDKAQINLVVDHVDECPTLVEQLRLPDRIAAGRYNSLGEPDPAGNLILGIGSGICHLWGAFSKPLLPGQRAQMDFTNVPGSYPVTGGFSEWIPGPPGGSAHAIDTGFGGARYKLLKWESGTWDVTVKVYMDNEKPSEQQQPIFVQGVETNSLACDKGPPDLGRWCVSHYGADFLGQRFEQTCLIGVDTSQGLVRYTMSVVKSFQPHISQFHGTYDEATRTMTWEGQVASCFGDRENPDDPRSPLKMVLERRVVTYVNDNEKRMKLYQPKRNRETGKFEERLRDETVAIRRQPTAGTNVPKIGNTLFTLDSLQRGYKLVRVAGRNTGTEVVPAAAGMVMLGPVWLQQFGDAVRL
jgi:hypothetical protein